MTVLDFNYCLYLVAITPILRAVKNIDRTAGGGHRMEIICQGYHERKGPIPGILHSERNYLPMWEHRNGIYLSTWEYIPLIRKETRGLESAGTRWQQVSLYKRGRDLKGKETADHTTLDDALNLLHSMAYRHHTRDGYTLDDISGFLMLTPTALEKVIRKFIGSGGELEEGLIVGATYYFKPGRKRRDAIKSVDKNAINLLEFWHMDGKDR